MRALDKAAIVYAEPEERTFFIEAVRVERVRPGNFSW